MQKPFLIGRLFLNMDILKKIQALLFKSYLGQFLIRRNRFQLKLQANLLKQNKQSRQTLRFWITKTIN